MEHKDLNILEKYLGKEFITQLKYKYEFANRKKHKQRIGTVKDRNTIFRSFLFKDKKLLPDFA